MNLAEGFIRRPVASTLVMAAILFAGIGGFHAMLDHAGGRCVYVSEIDREARHTYLRNWVEPLPESRRPVVNTDITMATPDDRPVDVPAHDVLAAGFLLLAFQRAFLARSADDQPDRVLERATPMETVLALTVIALQLLAGFYLEPLLELVEAPLNALGERFMRL